MITRSYTLKQHTRMLHFQGDQLNATLRATAVKPLFDRFLIETAFNNDFDKCKAFLVGYNEVGDDELKRKFDAGFRALNYKLKITVTGQHESRSTHSMNANGRSRSTCPMYFGNETYTVYGDIKVDFVFPTATEGLCSHVDEHFSKFINFRNFGIRATKGYGSFTLDGSSNMPKLYITFEANGEKDVEDQIDLFYKTIRSGINTTRNNQNGDREGYYFKSMLFSYIEHLSSDLRWDKKVIKNHYLRPRQNDKEQIADANKKDYRDLLGLSSAETWGYYKIMLHKEIDGVARYPSPIVFKPVKIEDGKWRIYIILGEVPEQILNRDVSVKASLTPNSVSAPRLINGFQEEQNQLQGLKTPTEFSLNDYFNFLFKKRPSDVSEADWSEAKDIDARFVKYTLQKWQESQIRNIVKFYKKLRKAYNSVK